MYPAITTASAIMKMFDFGVTRDEIFRALQSIKTNKNKEPDEIYLKLITEITNEMLSSLTTLFSVSLLYTL